MRHAAGRSRSGRGLALALPVVLAIVGCALPGGGDGDGASGGLVGTAWVVREIAGTTTLDAAAPTLDFGEDGRVTGTDGCNRYSMAFRTDGSSIELGDGQTTDMGCEPQIMAQADAFAQALGGATSWSLRPDGALELRGQGDLIAHPADAAPPPPVGSEPPEADALVDTAWVLIDLGGSDDLLGTVVTLEFAAEGSVSGSGGCNRYSGAYTVEGGTLAIGPLASTKRACEGPAGEIETTYLGALDAVGQWTIDAAGHLVLGGPTPLTFEPA